ncbi:50S ribosomal protein L30 [Actinomycetospora cinnamomea]|uniref:Large ribosomal subunit protein uL30 n=1 Tax=Actinomycetospora cinnamomea TaxID=663609 RepID=A0A2U1FDM5_9PSEU|nr:50S ribosomal protein L30 [Actinomycetospora cinnamomea]PVZ10259.1 LSU ribosomal protein L30P [Actinomycetospora cinnamomea]
MADLKVTQTRSEIGGKHHQRESLRSLGLRRIGASVVRPDTPQNRGLIKAVRHLVTVEEVENGG